jgi:hypothetical protein
MILRPLFSFFQRGNIMADSRVIHSGPRIDGRVYVKGMEDDLQGIATPAQLANLKKQGAISGDWGAKDASETATPESELKTAPATGEKSKTPETK